MHMTTGPRSVLPRALRANALASLVTGMAGVLMSAPLAEVLGVISGTNLQVLGGALLLHTGLLLWATGRATMARWTRINIAVLAIYVIALLGLLTVRAIPTGFGQALVTGDAVLVTALALWQVRALAANAPAST